MGNDWLLASIDRAKLPELKKLVHVCPATAPDMRTRAQHIDWLNEQRRAHWDNLHAESVKEEEAGMPPLRGAITANEANAFLRSLPMGVAV